MKVLLACNTLTAIQTAVFTDHARLFYRLGKDYPKVEFHQMFTRRLSIDRFRNLAFQIAINSKMDYLFFIDDDMQFDYTVFGKMLAACKGPKGYDIVAALNYVRGYPFDPMAYSYTDKEGNKRNLTHLEDEVIDKAAGQVLEVDAIGTAVCLLKMQKLRTVPPAWFVTGVHNTEDIYFCIKAKNHNKKIRIGVHTGAITGHLLDPESISYHTRAKLKAYYESYMSPLQIESINKQDRGIAYIDANVPEALDEERT